MNRDTQKRIEKEYGEPINSVVSGYLDDGESIPSIAQILEAETSDIRNICRHIGRAANPRRRNHGRPHSPTARARCSRSMRQRFSGIIHYAGRPTTYAELSEITGIPRDTIRMRCNRGNSIAQAIRKYQ